jgi:3-oxoacyl-[acyl-carrier-protein] synthase I
MVDVYIASDNIISSLGFTSEENFQNCKKGNSGIVLTSDHKLSQTPIHASLIDWNNVYDHFGKIADNKLYTKVEKLFILSITDALKQTNIHLADNKTLLIISTTKGNIDLLEETNHNAIDRNRLKLWETANIIKKHLNLVTEPLVVSHACISGLNAIILGTRLIKSGCYENVIVSGGDILTEFVISGFQSFKAISPNPCKPFDINRDGITLGEGCGTVILTSNPLLVKEKDNIKVLGGATSNDANHISGPSRTGDGLFYAIDSALKEAAITNIENIGFVSAHGTATSFNDEMEAKALKLAGLIEIPVNSLKGFFGHTLGAAGIIESIISIHSLKNNTLIPTTGFKTLGVTENISVITQVTEKKMNTCLKTASGFGGCNAAILYSKND